MDLHYYEWILLYEEGFDSMTLIQKIIASLHEFIHESTRLRIEMKDLQEI